MKQVRTKAQAKAQASEAESGKICPLAADFLIISATFPGFCTWTLSQGSPFTHTLCSQILKAAKSFSTQPRELTQALKRVHWKIARKFKIPHPDKQSDKILMQAPVFECSLVKDLYIPPVGYWC